jgi:hypothetical protein
MDQLKQRFPNDYRAYLFAGLYYGFFSTWNDPSLKPAMDNLDKAAETEPKFRAAPFLQSPCPMQQALFLKSMNWSDAQRADLNQRLLGELDHGAGARPQSASSDQGPGGSVFQPQAVSAGDSRLRQGRCARPEGLWCL